MGGAARSVHIHSHTHNTRVTLATERLPTGDTLTGSDTNLGKTAVKHRHSDRADSRGRLKCCQTHKDTDRPEA